MKPFERAVYPADECNVETIMRRFALTRAQAEAAVADMRHHEVWRNDRYQVVAIRRCDADAPRPDLIG